MVVSWDGSIAWVFVWGSCIFFRKMKVVNLGIALGFGSYLVSRADKTLARDSWHALQ